MQKNLDSRGIAFAIAAAAVVFIDEWLKFLALVRLPDAGSLSRPGLISLAVHQNWGVAFDIPFRMPLIIIVSVFIGIGLIRIVVKNWRRHPDIAMSALVIIIGACGNLYDRLRYGFTVDYLLLFGRSAINLSDVVIVAGVIALLLSSRRSRTHQLIPPDEPKR